ncbi:hypothetical protein NP05261_06490 [Helicobacter pylori]
MLPFIVGGAILAVGFGVLAAFFDVETEKEKERQNTLKKDRYRGLHAQSATG